MNDWLLTVKRRWQATWDFEAVVVMLNTPTGDGRVITAVRRRCCPSSVKMHTATGDYWNVGFYFRRREEDGRVIVTGKLRPRLLKRLSPQTWRSLAAGQPIHCCIQMSVADSEFEADDTDDDGNLLITGRLDDLFLNTDVTPFWPEAQLRLVLPGVFVVQHRRDLLSELHQEKPRQSRQVLRHDRLTAERNPLPQLEIGEHLPRLPGVARDGVLGGFFEVVVRIVPVDALRDGNTQVR